MSATNDDPRRGSLRDQQAELTRELIVRAFVELLQTTTRTRSRIHRSPRRRACRLRTVYRYFPTRADLLQIAAAWFTELTGEVPWDDPRTVRDLAAVLPQIGRLFDEHTNVFRALSEIELERPRRDAVAAAIADVSGNLAPSEVRGAEAMLGYIAPGARGSCSTSNTGSPATRSWRRSIGPPAACSTTCAAQRGRGRATDLSQRRVRWATATPPPSSPS